MINLVNGTYYSMDMVGGFLWELIEKENTLEEMITAIVNRYDVSQEKAQADVERLATELVQENLVWVSNHGEQGSRQQVPEAQEKLPYESPDLNAYRDMADLLALDPPVPGLQEHAWQEWDEGF